MGIRFFCPNGHKLNVKDFQAGQNGICPYCGAKMQIPLQSTRKSSKEERAEMHQQGIELAVSDSRPPELGMPAPTNTADAEAAFIQPRMPAAPTAEGMPPGQAPQTAPTGGQVVSSPAGPVQSPAAGQMQSLAPGQMQSPPGQIPSAPASPGGAMPGGPISNPAPAATPSPANQAPSAPASQAAPTPTDPLLESGNSVWYVRPLSGGQFGPATADIMRSWLEEGRISSDSMVWCEGWPDWVGAVTVFPQLGPAMAPGAASPGTAGPQPLPASTGTPSTGAPSRLSQARRRSRAKSTQAAVITTLILTVAALLIIFLVVITLN